MTEIRFSRKYSRVTDEHTISIFKGEYFIGLISKSGMTLAAIKCTREELEDIYAIRNLMWDKGRI